MTSQSRLLVRRSHSRSGAAETTPMPRSTTRSGNKGSGAATPGRPQGRAIEAVSDRCETLLAMGAVAPHHHQPLRQPAVGRDRSQTWFAELDDRLRMAYRTPERRLGNKRAPLDEALYIIL